MQKNYYENLHNLIFMLASILWTCSVILPSIGRIFSLWYPMLKAQPCVMVIHSHALPPKQKKNNTVYDINENLLPLRALEGQ